MSLAGSGAAPARPTVRGGLGLALVVLVSLGWGLNWPMMKLALDEIPVWTFRALCLVLAGASFFLLALALRQRIRLRRGEPLPLLATALFNIVGWHLLSGYGIQLIGAGKASIIGYTMPVWAALLGALLLRERLDRRTLLGLALGLGGVAVLLQEDLATFGQSPLGTLAMLGAAFTWALGTVLIKRVAPQLSLPSLAAWQFTLAAPVLIGGALLLEGPPRLAQVTGEAWLAMAYIVLVALVVCQLAWYRIVRLFPAAVAGLSTLAIPVVSLLSAALLLGEPLGWRQGLALLLVGASLCVVLVLPALARRRQATATPAPPIDGLGG
jgi:drug/metabolite transporter (DMT)-like permease